MSKEFFETVIYRSDESAGKRWLFILGLAIFLMPMVGSVGGGVVVLMAIFAIPYYIYRDIKFTRGEKQIAIIVCLYLGLNLAGAALFENHLEGLQEALSNSGFLCLILLLPVLRMVPMPDLEKNLAGIFAITAIVTGLAALFEFQVAHAFRAELKTGNPLMLSYLAGSIGMICLVFALNGTRRTKIFCLIGALAAFVTLILAGGKGPIVAMIVTAAFMVLASAGKNRRQIGKLMAILAISAAVLATGIYLARDTAAIRKLSGRYQKSITTVEKGDFHHSQNSTTVRVVYLQAAVKLIASAPLFGVGRQNVMERASQLSPPEIKSWFHRTHLHNAFLTEMAAFGIFGLAAFIAMLAIPVIAVRRGRKPTREAAIAFVMYSSLCFVTNIGFYHDITVLFFVLISVTLHTWAVQTRDAKPQQDGANG